MTNIKKTGVIGHPIGHSKSPLIHNYWIKKHGLEGEYNVLDIPPADLKNGIEELIERGYVGFNLTIPHKELFVPMCDELDDDALAIGAVNTVTIKDGKWIGKNTDAFGFTENIETEAPDFNFTTDPAMVLGAGGASRAVVYALLKQGVPEILLTNRTKERAENLAEDFENITVVDWGDKESALPDSKLLVNTTALGMDGQAALELDLQNLSTEALVCDIVYAPLMTNLLKKSQARGNTTVTGIGMLLHQARPAFKAWYGIMPDVDEELKKLVLK